MYSDLESDYINPIDLCTKLNQVRTRYSHSSRSQRCRLMLSLQCCFCSTGNGWP